MAVRIESMLRGPAGGWLAMCAVAVIATLESIAHGRFVGGSTPWWHLGVGVAFVLWGGGRFVLPVAAGTTIGIAPVVLAMSMPLELAYQTTLKLAYNVLEGATAALGLVLMLLVMGDHRRPIVAGRVDLPEAMRLVLLGVPVVLLPSMALQAGVATAMSLPLDVLAPRIVGAGLTGVLTAAPIMIAILPTQSRLTYRCHCNRPLIPLVAMSLLLVIGLVPLLAKTPISTLMPLVSVLSMGVLGWLSLASGWLATSMGVLVLAMAFWVGEYWPSTADDAFPTTNLPMLSPAFLIALLFAASMESRFRDRAGIAERHDELRTILGATGAALLRTDLDGRVTFANESARHLRSGVDSRLGEDLASWVGKRPASRLVPLLGNERSETEIVIENAGRVFHHHVVSSPLRGEGDQMHGHTIAIVDMNRRWQRESARREEQKRRYRTLANAYVHEVNTLAMAIGGAASMAREESDDTVLNHLVGSLEQSCETAQQKAERLRHMTQKPSRKRPIDLARTVRDRLTLAAGQGRIVLGEVDVEDDIPVRFDSGFACFIVDEFVQNAVDASKSGRPMVTARLRCKGRARTRAAILELVDDGPGIDHDLLGRIGRPFVSSKGDGRGLGLAAIRTGIRNAGGKLRIDSTDDGTSLRITIPLARDIEPDPPVDMEFARHA